MMDKELIKLIAAATGGLVVGGGLGYFITKARLEKKYAAIADEEIESVKKVYDLKLDETLTPEQHAHMVEYGTDDVEKTKKAFKGVIISEDRAGNPIMDVTPPSAEIENIKELLEDYNGSVDGPTFARVNYVAPEPEVEDEFFKGRDSREPYFISVDEFHEEKFQHYTKAMLTYYGECGTLVDDRMLPIDDIEQAVGPNMPDHFGDHSGNASVVYVRREENDIDFEITYDPRSFNEVVLGGLPSEDRLRKMREDD